ncbi:diadenylate cyclase CdaA [Desulfovibrio cuneatus]|uniref:diadenylate cyclase CdaA n=1 Tax=Desulfovibrio cuneatus TaxID=159728 RepID=UPI0004130C81|nr:diadenylate cyclase CdaA [Desulfovibrio cuneatus]
MLDTAWFQSFSLDWRAGIDIFLVTLLLYNTIVMVKQTRAVAAIYGLISIIAVYFVSRQLGLNTLLWILDNILSSLFILIIIVFQRDIRNALTTIGSQRWWPPSRFRKQSTSQGVGIIAEAAIAMAQQRIGALIVIERNVPLADTTERGVQLQAKLSRELLIAIFWPKSPLHDGAALIRGETIVAGGCILPLSTSVTKRDFGTRHRAAIGITEESDAVVVVVSEERGVVSVAVDGRVTAPLDEQKLKQVLTATLEATQ